MKGQILYDSSYKRYLEQSNSQRQKVEWWLLEAGGKEEQSILFNGNGVSVQDDEKALDMNSRDGCTAM